MDETLTDSTAVRPGRGLFQEALVAAAEAVRDHPQHGAWLDYALGTNRRGQSVVASLQKGLWWPRGVRLLDVGCGYGGLCLAAAAAGAEAVGIDLDPDVLALARLNSRDHPGLDPELLELDVFDEAAVGALGRFEVITCDNVIEHVVSPEALFERVASLLMPGGCVYVTIPNGRAVSEVEADCHYGLFGISLLDPRDGETYAKHALGQGSCEVAHYHGLSHYRRSLGRCGLRPRLWNSLDGSEEKVEGLHARVEALGEGLARALDSGRVPAVVRPKLVAALDLYRGELGSALSRFRSLPKGRARRRLARSLWLDHGEQLWYVLAAEGRGLRRFLSPGRIVRSMRLRLAAPPGGRPGRVASPARNPEGGDR